MKEFFKKIYPYLIVFAAFNVGILIMIYVADGLLLPSLLKGKKTIKVPDLNGKTLSEAESILEKNGLYVEKVTDQFADNVPSGVIINQVPKADQIVKIDRGVYLTISKGEQSVLVPNLVGQTLRAASTLLQNINLKLGNREYESSDQYGADTIIRQSMSAGQKISTGKSINITLSLGSEVKVKVPSLVSSSLERANEALKESNLQLGEVTYVKNETYISGTILSQTPQAGESVKQSSRVNLTVTK